MRKLYRVARPDGGAVLVDADYVGVTEQGELVFRDHPKDEEGNKRSIGGDVQPELVWIFSDGRWSDVRPANASEIETRQQAREPEASPEVDAGRHQRCRVCGQRLRDRDGAGDLTTCQVYHCVCEAFR